MTFETSFRNDLMVEFAPPTLPASGTLVPAGFTGHSAGYKRVTR
ncbi:MAG TPA: hypothetical protein VGJ64_06330 [Gemmatimonadaceae bacterium]